MKSCPLNILIQISTIIKKMWTWNIMLMNSMISGCNGCEARYRPRITAPSLSLKTPCWGTPSCTYGPRGRARPRPHLTCRTQSPCWSSCRPYCRTLSIQNKCPMSFYTVSGPPRCHRRTSISSLVEVLMRRQSPSLYLHCCSDMMRKVIYLFMTRVAQFLKIVEIACSFDFKPFG